MAGILPDTAALRKFSSSIITLLLANMIPVIGVLFWDWSIFEVMLVFWAENVVIGIINVFKILTASIAGEMYSGIAVIPFFIFHYGIFTMVHGAFILAFFGNGAHFANGSIAEDDMGYMLGLFFPGGLLFIPALSLFISHFYSYIINFIDKKEYTDPENLMFQPYGRVIVLHLATLFGGGLMLYFGAPIFALLLLIILKILLDLTAHVHEHKKLIKKDIPAT